MHSLIESTKAFPTSTHPHLVFCSVRDTDRLNKAAKKLSKNGIKFKCFYEPDIGNQFTSLATEPLRGDKRRVLKDFQLMKGENHGT